VHRIEDDDIGVTEELDETLGLRGVAELVLGVRRVGDGLAVRSNRYP
jgi:hypothetical protein